MKILLSYLALITALFFSLAITDSFGQDLPPDEIQFETTTYTTTRLGAERGQPQTRRSTLIVELNQNEFSMRNKETGEYYKGPIEIELVHSESDPNSTAITTYSYEYEEDSFTKYLFLEINTQGWSESGTDYGIEYPFSDDKGKVIAYMRWDSE